MVSLEIFFELKIMGSIENIIFIFVKTPTTSGASSDMADIILFSPKYLSKNSLTNSESSGEITSICS